MADLRDLLVSLGYNDVRTHLQSGNAVFASPKANSARLENEIEKGFQDTLGFTVRCFVRTGADLKAPNVGAFVEKHLKVAVTNRNWNTVTRLRAILDEA
jgi:uncharacterized protein (DUF1697 family)